MGAWLSRLLHRAAVQRPQGAGSALVACAEAWLEQGATESEGSNAGPDVSWLIHDGGGNPDKRPPWCAYFVSSVCRQVTRCGFDVQHTQTGRAVSHWQKAPEAARIMPDDVWSEDPRGLVMVRTRLSKDPSEAEKARGGMSRQGHTGIVTGIEVDAEGVRRVLLVCGNSSGHGHSRIKGSGAVAREVIVEGGGSWERLVGFVRVCSP